MTDTTSADRWDAMVRCMLQSPEQPTDVFNKAAETIRREMQRKGHSPEAADAEIEIVSELYYSRLLSIFPIAEHIQ